MVPANMFSRRKAFKGENSFRCGRRREIQLKIKKKELWKMKTKMSEKTHQKNNIRFRV